MLENSEEERREREETMICIHIHNIKCTTNYVHVHINVVVHTCTCVHKYMYKLQIFIQTCSFLKLLQFTKIMTNNIYFYLPFPPEFLISFEAWAKLA